MRMLTRLYDERSWDGEETNKMDPDDGNSTLCEACRLPIFSTPFTTPFYDQNNNNNQLLVLHDRCGNDHLPPKLEGRHPSHPKRDLIFLQHQTIINNNNNNYSCSRCDSLCGTSFYECDVYRCRSRLDLACALPMNSWVLHKSHPHRLTVIKAKSLLSSFTCGVCEAQHHHDQPRGPEAAVRKNWQVYYVCIPCDFWIHPDCALLPNAIQFDDEKIHPHPLLLRFLHQNTTFNTPCEICDQLLDPSSPSKGVGAYECFHCDYIAHIKCALYSHHVSFKRVLIRDAQVPDLLRLPMPNETTSVMTHILTTKTTNGGTTSSGGDHQMISDGGYLLSLFKDKKIHEHPLILHDHDDDPTAFSGGGVARICNACVQLISPSKSFYTCSFNNNNNNELVVAAAAGGCRDFFVHTCCAQYLPTKITTKHLFNYKNNHLLDLVSRQNIPHDHMFMCNNCQRQCNGFAYACESCSLHFDVVCAFMYTSITHAGHASSHILLPFPGGIFSSLLHVNMCICCDQRIYHGLELGYICSSCSNFNIHAKCALLPDTVSHKFDRHPLKLITTTTQTLSIDDRQLVRGEQMFCEICENDIKDTATWHYGCRECDQYFHTDCIPSVDRLSKIKFGFTIHVPCHDCPLVAVRALSVEGYRCQCGTCEQIIITESDEIAYECSECYFRIRKECAA